MIDRLLLEADHVAREHIIWARLQGMKPVDVLRSVDADLDQPLTWETAERVIKIRWINLSINKGDQQCAA